MFNLRRFLITFLILAPLLMAVGLLQEVSAGTMEAIAFLISVLVGFIGPKPLETVIGWLGLQGQWAVLFTYAVALVVGAGALAVSGQLFEIAFTWDNALAIAGLLFAAATYAFHRLKDQGAFENDAPPLP